MHLFGATALKYLKQTLSDVYCIYEFSLSPKFINPSEILKVDSGIIESYVDPTEFVSKAKIILTTSFELAQDMQAFPELKRLLHKRLDEILDYPEENKIKMSKDIIVRGIF